MRIDLPEPEIFRQITERVTGQSLSSTPTGITLDAREAKPGDIFVAIQGERVDGHQFLNQAEEVGCSAALVSTRESSSSLSQIEVEDTSHFLGKIAQEWRTQFSLPVIGITGSNGKTTTKDLLTHIFSDNRVHATRGNFNTHLGIPLTLLELTSRHTLSILEMGANHLGDIGYLCGLSKPDHGLITNIAPAHLNGFGTLDNIVKAKGELFDSLPEDGYAFVNWQDSYIKDIPTAATKITYGFSHDCDFATDIDKDNNGMIILTINSHEIDLNLCQDIFALNVISACSVSITLGVEWDTFREKILSFEPSKGRCQIKKFDGITIIDDTYNANLNSTLSALDYLKSIPGNGRRIMVFGDMLELGSDSENHHKKVGDSCAAKKLDLLLCYGNQSNVTVNTAESIIEAQHFDEKKRLSEVLRENIKEGDVILFKGSRGMAMETVIEEVFEN